MDTERLKSLIDELYGMAVGSVQQSQSDADYLKKEAEKLLEPPTSQPLPLDDQRTESIMNWLVEDDDDDDPVCVLLLKSLCKDNSECSDKKPCIECLQMCNVFEVHIEKDAMPIGQLKRMA